MPARVSRLLGHASPTITLDVSVHMLPNEQYGSAERLVELVFADGANIDILAAKKDATFED